MSIGYWCQLFHRSGGFQMLGQCVDDLLECSSLKPFLLRSTPLLRGLCSATRSCGCQILTDMIVIAQKSALSSKDFFGLQPDPFGSISQCVDLAIESPTGAPSAVTPTSTNFVNFTKGA